MKEIIIKKSRYLIYRRCLVIADMNTWLHRSVCVQFCFTRGDGPPHNVWNLHARWSMFGGGALVCCCTLWLRYFFTRWSLFISFLSLLYAIIFYANLTYSILFYSILCYYIWYYKHTHTPIDWLIIWLLYYIILYSYPVRLKYISIVLFYCSSFCYRCLSSISYSFFYSGCFCRR